MGSRPKRMKDMNRFTQSIDTRHSFQLSKPRLLLTKWRMDSWFPQIKIRMRTADEIKRYDPRGLAFSNINTAGDLVQDERRASGQPTPGTERD
jgi:hypothetical protein